VSRAGVAELHGVITGSPGLRVDDSERCLASKLHHENSQYSWVGSISRRIPMSIRSNRNGAVKLPSLA
jgi:hypothetical protein